MNTKRTILCQVWPADKRWLTAEQVREIRASKESYSALGRRFGVSKVMIFYIKHYRAYRDVA